MRSSTPSSHSGKAEVGAVVGKSMGATPELRGSGQGGRRRRRQRSSRAVNSLSLAGAERLLEERYPDALRRQGRTESEAEGRGEGTRELSSRRCPGAVQGEVVLRLPPEPSGYMHIGHAMAGVINATYRDMYKGELWLRFEDTNPKKVRKVYYQSFRDGYAWLGITWDHEKNVSSDMDVLYLQARRLIEMGAAYACACPADLVKKLRFEGEACEHRRPVRPGEPRRLGRDARQEVQGGRVGHQAEGRPRQPRPLPQGPEHPQGDRRPASADRGRGTSSGPSTISRTWWRTGCAG